MMKDIPLSISLGNALILIFFLFLSPLKWMAHETFLTRTYTHKSDVWSFAVLCIEILTRLPPFPEMTTEEFALRVLPEKLRPIKYIPEDTPAKLKELICQCLDFVPEKRPDFQTIFASL